MSLFKSKGGLTSGQLHRQFDQTQVELLSLGQQIKEAVNAEREAVADRLSALSKLIASEQASLSRLDVREAEIDATVALLTPYVADEAWSGEPAEAAEAAPEAATEWDAGQWDSEHIVPAATENLDSSGTGAQTVTR